MRTWEYIIQDALGIHARPAGLLVKEAKQYESKIEMKKGEKAVDCKKLMALMGLGVIGGDKVTLVVDGPDEEAAEQGMKAFLEKHL